jgi:prolipoprotein diacylglyceryltransferase
MICVYKRKFGKYKNGFIFGVFIFSLFFIRFLIEFLKISQESFEDKMILDMGQLLSIPFILWGIALMISKRRKAQLV